MGEREKRQNEDHESSKATRSDAEADAATGPQHALRTAVASGCRAPEDFARFIEGCPSLSSSVMSALHQQFGNAYVQAVVVSMQGSTTPVSSGQKSVASHATATKPAIDAPPKNVPPLSVKEASDVLYVAMQILAGRGKPAVDGFKGTSQTSRYKADLEKLYLVQSAMHQGAKTDGQNSGEAPRLSAAEKSRMFAEARGDLMPLVELSKSDFGIAEWNAEELVPRFDELATDLAYDVANERVKSSVLLGPGEVVEMPDDSEPREQGRVLHLELPKLVVAIKTISEQLVRLNEHALEHEAEQMLHSGARGKKFGSLAELGNVLMLADAWLTLNDKEFKEHLAEIHGLANGVATYSELVKVVMELAAGASGVVCSIGGLIARASGDSALAATCSGAARAIGLGKIGTAVAYIEVAHGIAVLFDKTATPERKMSAAGDVATSVAWLGGKRFVGAAFGAAASSAVLAGYAELKWAITAYSESVIGWDTGILRDTYNTLQMYGEQFPPLAEDVARAHALVAQESDPERKQALARVEIASVHLLAGKLDSLIADCGPQGMAWNALEGGRSTKPGSVQILQDWFAPLRTFRGAQTPDGVMNGAALAMSKIAWARTHARDVLAAVANGRDIVDLQQSVSKHENEKSDKHE